MHLLLDGLHIAEVQWAGVVAGVEEGQQTTEELLRFVRRQDARDTSIAVTTPVSPSLSNELKNVGKRTSDRCIE